MNYMISIAAGVPFGFGMILVFLGIMNYLIDAYTIYAASVLAANAVLRSLFGTAFPLFTTQMYSRLGIHWASTIPAFLALICVPFPFLFYKYGAKIRSKCKYAAEAEAFLKKMQKQSEEHDEKDESDNETAVASSSEDRAEEEKEHKEEEREEEEQEAIDLSYEDEPAGGRFEQIKTHQRRPSAPAHTKSYEANPFDLDRVNTRESFKYERNSLSRTTSRNSKSLSRTTSRTSRK